MKPTIDQRKDEHIKICQTKPIRYSNLAGFEDIMLAHNALPEIDFNKVDTSTTFLKRKIAAPLMISAMTGGTPLGGEINKRLAHAAQEAGIPLALGSQRPMLKDSSKASFYKVRKYAPDIPIIGNVGGVQLREYTPMQIESLVSAIEADALAIHLNALQEIVQPEGDVNFEGVLSGISKICEKLPVPVIVKETGAGINGAVAKKLFDAGVKIVEVSGRGGTSWSKVEYERGGTLPGFGDWGYPSVLALAECAPLGEVICSGGVSSGIDAAKGVALGAKVSGAALPFLKAKDASEEARAWIRQIRGAMFLCGAKNVEEMARAPLLISGMSADLMRARGIDIGMYSVRSIEAAAKKMDDDGIKSHYL